MEAIQNFHIQDYDSATSLEPHWGYADRVVPCTNDAGSCAYLDLVYGSHDRSMIYTGIMYAALGGLLLLWASSSYWLARTQLSRTCWAFIRRYTLPESRRLRWLFGRVTRLQILLLAALSTYLLIFSFVGMEYRKWVTPVAKMPGVHNTRTTLGPFADRVGIFAYALTPISILLSSRESLLSVITGVPYQHFNFLHRWIGHIIMIQALVHTIGWTIVETKLYQPQPSVAEKWIKQLYMIWGCVAMILLLLLWVLATPIARRAFGYEFFRKAHWVLAMLYVGACWGHWDVLKCFMIPSLGLWALDRAIRLVRTALTHYRVFSGGHGMFTTFEAKITHFDADVIRLDIDVPGPFSFQVGQHYFLTFPKGSIWQSHPFTPLSLPGDTQSYIIRAKRGETKRITQFSGDTTPVILTGPYGRNMVQDLDPKTNVLCIAGGTGITFVLPVLLHLASLQPSAQVQLIWVVRHTHETEWIGPELTKLLACQHIGVTVYTTRDNGSSSTLPTDACQGDNEKEQRISSTGRPDIASVVDEFISRSVGQTTVYVSAPPVMVTTVRNRVAAANSAAKVWRGDDQYDVQLVYDDRLE